MPASYANPPAGRDSAIAAGLGPQQHYMRPSQPYNDGREQDDEHQYQRMDMVEGEVDDGVYGQSYDKRDSRTSWPMTDEYDRVEAPESMSNFARQASLVPRQRGQARTRGGSYASPYVEEY